MAIARQSADFQTLRGPVPPAISRFHLQPLGSLPETNQLRFDISLPLRNQQALDGLLREIYDPRSPNYHHYLTPAQFTARFGPSPQDYDAVIQFVRSNGMTVVGVHSNRTLLDATASVGAIQKAFHTKLRLYRHPFENRAFFAPETDPTIGPGVPIKHIDGLDNFFAPRPLIKKEIHAKRSAGASPADGSGPGGAFMGRDFPAAYAPGVALDGAGQIVGLFELDGYYSNDIASYEQQAGLPAVTLTNVILYPFDGTPSSYGDPEVSLDIEMAISMATNLSEVIVYEATNSGSSTDIADLLSRIASDDLAKQISSSWLIGDSSTYDTYYQEMALQGQSFFQASGDEGAYYPNISEWADDTNITLVGGTTLSTSGPSGAWASETTWNWYASGAGTNGSGGGVNFNAVPIPSWQKNVGMTNNGGSATLRNVPDVALTADNIYVVYENGQNGAFGGTSCAAPLWAGFTAMINQQALARREPTVGFINPAVYAIGLSGDYTNCFHDITTGNNTNSNVGNKYYATNGYDLCTGWGTPTGSNLINALTAPPDTLMITPAGGFAAAGPVGGPFVPESQIYSLTNTGGSPLEWALGNTSSWLVASITNGALDAGTGTNVIISIAANADLLGLGDSAASITFTNISSNTVQSLQFSLQTVDPLVVAPGFGFTVSGAEGGPFAAASQTFTLTNIGSVPLTWQAGGPAWLELTPSNGILDASATATVTASLNATGDNFGAGIYNGQVAFTDDNSGFVQDRHFSLSIGQNIVLNGGFETGDFTDWDLVTNGFGTIVDNGDVSGISPQSGIYFAGLGQYGSLGYVSQTLATVTNQSYLLSFWLYSPTIYSGNHREPNTPNQLTVSWGGNTLFNETDIAPINGWTNLQFFVTATGPQTLLQFGERDDPFFLGLDNVNVWPLPLPNVRGFARTPTNAFTLTWYSFTNIAYQVQYSTNLAAPDWLNLNTYKATGPVLTVTNSIGSNSASFYRVLQLP